MTDDTQPTRFHIEQLCDVTAALDDTLRLDSYQAWVPVGSIEQNTSEFGPSARDALTAWEGEQEPRPPVGAYRVWHHETYAIVGQQFEIIDRIEREINRVEGPLEQQLKNDITAISIAALTPADGEGAA